VACKNEKRNYPANREAEVKYTGELMWKRKNLDEMVGAVLSEVTVKRVKA